MAAVSLVALFLTKTTLFELLVWPMTYHWPFSVNILTRVILLIFATTSSWLG
jgi:hypothetical protein